MQVSELNSAAPVDPPTIDAESQIRPDHDPKGGTQPSETDNNNKVIVPTPDASDNQPISNIPTLLHVHGTTSHVDSPHPTTAGGQADQAITPAGEGQTRRLSISSPKMLFSDLYKSTKAPLSKWRHHSHSAPTASDYDPDLVSKDKVKQKNAIKRVLADKVRNDWQFEWPPPSAKSNLGSDGIEAAVKAQEEDPTAEGTDSEDDAASVYSTVSEDLAHFRPRTEWLSDIPDDDDFDVPMSPSAYRFDSPDAVGTSVKAAALAGSAKRRKAVRDEMEWNDGLACFNARRDAWTGAKAARVRPKVVSPATTSPATRRLSFWGHLATSPSPSSPTESVGVTTPLSPSGTRTSGDTTCVASSDADAKEVKPKDTSAYPVETLIPIPQPLLPPATPMRASITPAAYSTIYDKIVLQSATPSCPVNLGDVVRSCVAGWKRDGEWPPRATEPPPVVAVRKRRKDSGADKALASRRMSFNFLGRRQSVGGDPSNLARSKSQAEREEAGHAGKVLRKSLQRVLGLGHERLASNASNQGAVPG